MKTFQSKVGDFDLHIRDGYIVPMMDMWTDVSNLTINNTIELQNNPIDLHINPTCNGTVCTAQGRFINDNGNVKDYKGHQNRYDFTF